MLNVEEATEIISNKMQRFLDWSIYSISEDDANYYFIYGATDKDTPDPDMPVFRVSKSDGGVSTMEICNRNNFAILYAARVFYNRRKNINYSVEERAAIRRKYNNPDAYVTCPRCGQKLVWIKQNTSLYVQCSTKYCIYCSIRKW